MNATATPSPAFIGRVLAQTVVILLLVNLTYGQLPNTFTAYGNALLPARPRLPYASNPAQDYSIALDNLPAMFATHTLAHTRKAANEYRVLLLGDSATWGFLLSNADTLASQLNQIAQPLPDGRQPRFHNIGYPTLAVSKDLLWLTQARAYQPDLVIWLLTLEALPKAKQLESPLVQSHRTTLQQLLPADTLDWQDARWQPQEPWLQTNTLFGQRKAAADWLRLQLYAVPWAATGIDQHIPATLPTAQQDLAADATFQGLTGAQFSTDVLAWQVLQVGIDQLAPTPVWLVNEPMLRSNGANSDIRYNFFYPRSIYDTYRQSMADLAAAQGWHWLDWWDRLPNEVFTDSAIHYNPAGSRQLATMILTELQAPLTQPNPK